MTIMKFDKFSGATLDSRQVRPGMLFVAIKGDPGFVDYANRDYRLKPDSEIFRLLPGFKPIPFERIGLIHRR